MGYWLRQTDSHSELNTANNLDDTRLCILAANDDDDDDDDVKMTTSSAALTDDRQPRQPRSL